MASIEYIVQIRQFVKPSEESHIIYSQDKFFDSVTFWKQAYEASEAEQSKLLDRIYELEQRNEALIHKAQTGELAIKEAVQAPSKRKATTKDVIKGTTMRKRAKTQPSLTEDISGVGSWGGYENIPGNLKYIEEATAPFMRHFYTLQKVLQKRPNNQHIVQAAIGLCQASADGLSHVFHESKAAAATSSTSRRSPITQSKLSNLAQALRSVDCAVNLLVQAVKRLSGVGNESRDSGLVIYSMVCLYETVMNTLGQYCKIRSEQTLPDAKSRAKSSRQKKTTESKGAAARAPSDGAPQPVDEGARQITWLLSQMITALDISCGGHQNLLEGFLFIFLRRVGKLLCLFVFQDLQLRPDLRIDPVKLSSPEGLLDAQLDINSLRAVQMEARHLIWPLERAMAVLAACPSSTSATSTIDSELKGTQVLQRIRASLQSTLLQAVFGADTAWGDTLRCPVQPGDRNIDRLRSSRQLAEIPTPDWFVQEVWRLLGWEVLAMSGRPDEEAM